MSETRQLKVVVAGDAKSAREALKVLGTGLAEADKKTKGNTKGMGEFSSKISEVAKNGVLAMAGLALAGAGVGEMFAQAIDLSDAKAKFAAQIGDSQFAADLGNVAGRLYANNFGESIADNMEGVRKVMTSGLLPEDAADADIERITGKALNLSKVFGQDVSQSARAAGQMVKTGLAKNADQAFDILTRGFQQTGDHAEDLLDTMNEYGTQFRKLGLDGTTATGLLSQGLKGGARDADLVADALKEFSIRAVDGSKSTAAGFKALGLNGKKMSEQIGKGGTSASKGLDTVLDRLRAIKDPVKRSQAAVALFGTQAEDLGAALYALDPSKAAKGMGDVAGAADRMGQALNQSAGAQLESFKRKIQTAIIEKLAAAIPKLLEFGNWMVKNRQWIAPLVVALGTFVGILATITAAVRIYTAVQAALNLVMAANPIGLVVIAIAALAAGIIYLWKNNAAFRNFIIAVWNGIKTGVMAAVNWLKVAIPAAWHFIVSFVMLYVNTFRAVITTVFNAIRAYINFVVGAWRAVILGTWSAIKTGTSNTWLGIKAVVTGSVNAVRTVVTAVVSRVRSAVSSAWNAVKSSTSSAWNSLKGIVSSAVNGVMSVVNSIKGKITGALSGAYDLLKDSGRKIIDGLADGIRNGLGRVKDAINDVLASARRLLPFSPAKEGPFSGKGWTLYSGRSIPEALAKGIASRRGLVVNAARSTMAGAHAELGLASRSLATVGAGGGGVNVTVHVRGSVTAERDLAKSIATTVRDEIARKGKRNGGDTGL